MKKLWSYLRTLIIISLGIVLIVTGMYWGLRTWGMRNVHIDIDWVEFIKFNDITYLITSPPVSIPTENLAYFDSIRYKLNENVKNPNYRSKNSDAAFLDAGTPVYIINGYSPKFRLWADNHIYEADTNPKARTGADLLDIGGKVDYIGIGSETAETVNDPEQVGQLVEMILKAPVKQNISLSGERISIYFHLKDGTTICRSFLLEQGQLQRGIMLPKECREIMKPDEEGNP